MSRDSVSRDSALSVARSTAAAAAAARQTAIVGNMDDEDELLAISYQGVTPGVPVLTRDGTQFGILEHVLEVPEEDVFDGIVVWTGGGGWLDRRIQRDLGKGAQSAARRLELLQPAHLRFVDADHVAAITTAYIRCDIDTAQAAALPPPSRDSPLYSTTAIDQAQPPYGNYGNGPWHGNHAMYGAMFRRARWTRES